MILVGLLCLFIIRFQLYSWTCSWSSPNKKWKAQKAHSEETNSKFNHGEGKFLLGKNKTNLYQKGPCN